MKGNIFGARYKSAHHTAALMLQRQLEIQQKARENGGKVTDRYAGYLITLDADIREDDAQATIAAIKQIKGVADVTPLIADPGLAIAKIRARREIIEKFWEVLE